MHLGEGRSVIGVLNCAFALEELLPCLARMQVQKNASKLLSCFFLQDGIRTKMLEAIFVCFFLLLVRLRRVSGGRCGECRHKKHKKKNRFSDVLKYYRRSLCHLRMNQSCSFNIPRARQ